MENTNRSQVLDSLKGIGIVIVLLFHSGALGYGGMMEKVRVVLERGVHLFFVVSVILMFLSLEHAGCGKSDFKAAKWYYNKFLRLIPLYYLALMVYFIINGFEPSYWSGSHGINIWTALTNFLFLNGFWPWHINAIMANWYIGTLAIFIMISPILFKLIKNVWQAFYFTVFNFGLMLFCKYVIAGIYPGQDTAIWVSYWTKTSIFQELPIIGIGIMLYFIIYKEKWTDKLSARVKECGINGAAVSNVMLIFILFFAIEVVDAGVSSFIYCLCIGLIVFTQYVSPSKMITNSFFVFMGKYSYGIYLSHYLILDAIVDPLVRLCGNEHIAYTIACVVTGVLSLLLSMVLTKYVEKPIVNRLKK